MLLLKKVLIFFIIAAAVFILFVFREEYKSRIYKKRVEYVFDKSRGERTAKLRLKYLREYNSVVGYFEQMNSNTGKCGDYDGITQKCYCSVTGEEMDYLQLCRCQKAGKCQDCPKFDDFISSI